MKTAQTLYGSNYGTPGNKRSYGYFNSVTGAGGIVLRNGIAMGTAASNSHGFALRELFHARMGMSMREFRARTPR